MTMVRIALIQVGKISYVFEVPLNLLTEDGNYKNAQKLRETLSEFYETLCGQSVVIILDQDLG